jgi:Holliday junction DNA helicase RuvA
MSERIVAKLRRKMAKFALMIAKEFPQALVSERSVLNDAFEALLSLGHNSVEAREKIDSVAATKAKLKSVEDVLLAIYQQERN